MLLLTLGLMLGAGPVSADAIYFNARIWTGEAEKPQADALAVWQGKILAIGEREAILQLAGPRTERHDLQGRRVLPGFHDSHAHFLGGGLQLARVDLKDAPDEAEFGRRLRAFDQALPRERWMLGGKWDHELTFKGTLPNAQTLDRYVKDRPVYLQRYDGHMGLANTAALKIAGINENTPDPPGGVIDRLPGTRIPSGILRDQAQQLILEHLPAPTDEEIREAIHAAMKAASRHGITTIQDMDGNDPPSRARMLRILHSLAQQGRLTVRLNIHWPIARWKELETVGITTDFGNDLIRLGGVKGFMDGSLGASTARMFEPYLADPQNRGVFVTDPATMRNWVRAADQAGLLVAIHAIGDEANSQMLDIFSGIAREKGSPACRFRIEHAQHLRPADYPRFSAGGVIASMQPYHVIDDGRWAENRIGAKRCASSYAFRSLLDAGAILAFGSDWPVAPLNPLLGIDAAVNRRTLDGKHPHGWFPEQAITVTEAIKAYTLGSAYAARQEHDRGTLATGKYADFVVLDRDPMDPAQKDHLSRIRVLRTVLGGRTVFVAPEPASSRPQPTK